MDVDAYVLKHRDTWNRLAELSGRTKLSGAEADEIIDLYQRTATHLAVVRGSTYDPNLEARLSTLVTNARAVITGTSVPLLKTVAYFFTASFPAAVYRLRYGWLTVALISVVTAFLIGYRMITVPGLESSLLPPERVRQIVEYDFEAYYSSNPAGDFATAVWLNNTLVTATVMLTGIAVLPLLWVWWQNIENLGVMGGLMVGHGRADIFYGLLLPHGLLELTCIFIGIAAGLSMAWAVISPGPRTRGQAIAEQGRRVGVIAIGLGLTLAVAGLLEAFLTPSQLPAVARLGIGGAVWLGFLIYVFLLGWRATRGGETGDLTGAGAQDLAPTEAAM